MKASIEFSTAERRTSSCVSLPLRSFAMAEPDLLRRLNASADSSAIGCITRQIAIRVTIPLEKYFGRITKLYLCATRVAVNELVRVVLSGFSRSARDERVSDLGGKRGIDLQKNR